MLLLSLFIACRIIVLFEHILQQHCIGIVYALHNTPSNGQLNEHSDMGHRPYAKMATIDFCYLVKFLQPLMVQHQKEMK